MSYREGGSHLGSHFAVALCRPTSMILPENNEPATLVAMHKVIEIFADMPQKDGSTVRYVPYWYKKDQCFQALERSGDGSNKKECAVQVYNLNDLLKRIEDGFAVRMTPPEAATSPRRIPPTRITVVRA